MAEKVAFELVSPERVLASEEADMVVVPGAEGDFGVLPDHAPLVSLLRPGVIGIFEGDRLERSVFVEGGFAEVNPQGLIVLAEAAEAVEDLQREEAQERLRNAQEDLDDLAEPSDSERHWHERQITIARARLEALEART